MPHLRHGSLGFVVRTFIDRGVTDIVFTGDIFDHQHITRHELNPNNPVSAVSEYKKTAKMFEEWKKEFPIAKVCIGNHDDRIDRKAREAGMPSQYIKNLRELYDMPEEWDVRYEHIIDGVYYTHGTRRSGINAHRRLALEKGMSSVMGHIHSNGGISYINNGIKTFFGMNVGCLVDEDAIAFEYGKHYTFKGVQGVGIVYSRTHAEFVPR